MTLRRRAAYTLIELLTVIAITAILMTIIVLPIIDSFNLLRAGQGWSEAQERARILLDRISREVAKGAGVRDNSGIGGQITVMVPPGPGSFDTVPIPELLSYAKMDIYKPAEGEPQVDALGNPVYVDPVTGKIDPTLRAPKGQALLPATAGSTLVRYFIALRDPFAAPGSSAPANYNNGYDGLLMARNGNRDNLYVLYRAEVQPYVYNGTTFVGNTNFFNLDANNNPILDDPNFMIADGTAAKAAMIRAWLGASVVQTEVSRYDMILPVYNKNSRAVAFDKVPALTPGNFDFAPRLVPLLQFRPTRISNEPATQQRPIRIGEESDNSGNSGADVIRTVFGEWSNPVVRSYPVALSGASNPATNLYQVGRNGTRSDGSFGFSEYQLDPTLGLDDTTAGVELFDFTTFNNVVNNPPAGLPYPFTAAVAAANTRSGWIANLNSRQLFSPYQPDSANGQLLASFSIDEVGLNALAIPRLNLPLAQAGTVAGIPSNGVGPFAAGTVWAGPGYTINDAYNLAWDTYNGQGGHGNLHGDNMLQRFIDLRLTANEDTTYGPLFPDGAINILGANVVINGNQGSFARAAIVPGSEIVWGPDQNPGPNYGNEIRYTRTTQVPGPNQYKINYVAQPQPVNPISGLIDYTMLGLTGTDLTGFNPAVYDPTNFVSAVIQARYMAGYIQLNSDPGVPLDTTKTPFRISYRFQFTNPNDSFAVDYDSRQVMSLLLTLHDYPQTTLPNPQTMTLKTTATVRNFLR